MPQRVVGDVSYNVRGHPTATGCLISLQKIPEFRTPNELIWKGEWYVTKTRTVLMPESTGINFVERLLSEVIKYEMTSQTAEMVEGL